MKHLKSAFSLMLAASMTMSMTAGVNAKVKEEKKETDYVYALVNIPYADFYYGELNDFSAKKSVKVEVLPDRDPVAEIGYREDSGYDAISSPTARLKACFPNVDKEIYTNPETGKDALRYKGFTDMQVAIPADLYEKIIDMEKKGKENKNPAFSLITEDTEVFTTPVSTEYKILNADGTLSRMVTDTVTDKVASAEIAPNTRYGEYLITISDFDTDQLDESVLLGVVLIAKDKKGNVTSYGMRHTSNIYRQAQSNLIAFCTTDGFAEFRDKKIREYKTTKDLTGQTITSIRYILKDAADIIIPVKLEVKEQLTDPYDGEFLAEAVSVADMAYAKKKMETSVTVKGLPDSYDLTLKSIKDANGNSVKANFKKKTGVITINQAKDMKPGSYTATFSDDRYIDVSAGFVLESGLSKEDLSIVDNKLVMNSDLFTLDDYMSAMTSIKIDDTTVSGSSFKTSIFFNDDYTINTDANAVVRGSTVYYFDKEAGESFEVTITAAGYPDLKGIVIK